MPKYLNQSNLSENVVYQFQIPYDGYTYAGTKPWEDRMMPAQWGWPVTLLSATIKTANGDEAPMPGPVSKGGPVSVGEEKVYWQAGIFWHNQALQLNMMKGAVINICAEKVTKTDNDGNSKSYMNAGIELVSQGTQYPINGNCKTFDGVAKGSAPIPCEDPAWVAMVANGQATPNTTVAHVVSDPVIESGTGDETAQASAPPATTPAQKNTTPVNGPNNEAVMTQVAARIGFAIEAVSRGLGNPIVEQELKARGYDSIPADQFYTFVRGALASLDRANFQVTEERFLSPYDTSLIDFDVSRIEAEAAAEVGEAAIMGNS